MPSEPHVRQVHISALPKASQIPRTSSAGRPRSLATHLLVFTQAPRIAFHC